MNVNKKLLSILIVIMLFIVPVTVLAEDDYIYSGPSIDEALEENNSIRYQLILEDNADLFSDGEEELLRDQMKDLLKYGHIGVVTTNENSRSTSSFAEVYYHSHFSTQSGTLFVIDMDNREIYIFSDGENYKTITRSKAYIITDNNYLSATAGKYYECAKDSLQQVYDLLEGRKIAEPMKHISNFILAITCAFFINFYIVLKVSKIKKAEKAEILKNCDIRFDIGEISALKIGEHKVYNPPSDSSSGGGGGGGGGGSSGGGGGHGF